MKVKGSELGQVIRMIVKEELEKLLPKMISECLAERYLKKVMAEVARPRQPQSQLQELMQGDREAETDWEEETPETLPNKHKGIYHQNPMVKGDGGGRPKHESVDRKELLAKVMGGMPSDIFEGVNTAHIVPGAQAAAGAGNNPVMLSETQQKFGEEGVPLEMLAKFAGTDFSKVKDAAGAEAPAPMNETYEMKMRQLELRRKALDVKA